MGRARNDVFRARKGLGIAQEINLAQRLIAQATPLMAAVSVRGCSPAPVAPDWEGAIEEVAGVVRVTNPERGLWEDREREPLRFVLEQTFGVDRESVVAVGSSERPGVESDDLDLVVVCEDADEFDCRAPTRST